MFTERLVDEFFYAQLRMKLLDGLAEMPPKNATWRSLTRVVNAVPHQPRRVMNAKFSATNLSITTTY